MGIPSENQPISRTRVLPDSQVFAETKLDTILDPQFHLCIRTLILGSKTQVVLIYFLRASVPLPYPGKEGTQHGETYANWVIHWVKRLRKSLRTILSHSSCTHWNIARPRDRSLRLISFRWFSEVPFRWKQALEKTNNSSIRKKVDFSMESNRVFWIGGP